MFVVPASPSSTPKSRSIKIWSPWVLWLIAGAMVLTALGFASIFVGSGDIETASVLPALQGEGAASTVVIVRDYRLPRTIMAMVVGLSLGVAGLLMQASTRNPLADPGLLGINAGAYLAVVLTSLWAGSFMGIPHVLAALVGAAAATVVVHGIGNYGFGAGTPAKLVLTGVALGAVLIGISTAISLLNPDVFDRVRYWNSGSLQGTNLQAVQTVLPFITVGVLVALFLPRHLAILALGEDSAVSLGTNPRGTRIAAACSVTLLCGAATAAVGPVSFVGLLVPHALRMIVGPSVTRLLLASIIAGPILVLSADMAGRVLVRGELPMGVVTALLGAPVLIFLVKFRGVRSL